MIKVEDINVFNLAGAIEGMRFPMQSWEKSDSKIEPIDSEFRPGHFKYVIGPNDLALAQKLISAGSPHDKFLRQIMVSMNITAPLYLWKEISTYCVGVTVMSESTMHTLSKKPITKECFSFDGLYENYIDERSIIQKTLMDDVEIIINICEGLRKDYVETGDKVFWRSLIQLLPSSWNQMRHWSANYAVLRNIYTSRIKIPHRLIEWAEFGESISKLPYYEEFIKYG